MGKLLKRKMAMCSLAASLFGTSNNSSANEQINMNQLIKSSLAVGAGAGVIGLAIVVPLIIMNSKADEKAVEKKMYQENKNKLQNLFNEQAKECEIKNIQKYWDALNKIAQGDWNDIFKKAIDKRLDNKPESIKFDNVLYYDGNDLKFELYSKHVDDYIDGKSPLPIADNLDLIKEREEFKSILNNKNIISDYSFIGHSFRDLKKIINGEFFLNSLDIRSLPQGTEFKFKYLNEFELEVYIYRCDFLDIGSNGKSYEHNISIGRKHNGVLCDKLVLGFTDLERDFGLSF